MSQQTCIGFVQADAAGLEGDHHRRAVCIQIVRVLFCSGLVGIQGQAENANHFGSVNFTDRAADEASLLGDYKDRTGSDASHTGDHAVVEAHRLA